MKMSTLCTIKYMNRSYFSKARYMIGVGFKILGRLVGFKILGRTPVPKLPPSYPPPSLEGGSMKFFPLPIS